MIKLYNLDVREALKRIPDESINCVITSPPYWALRDYGEGTESIFDGKENCNHDFSINERKLHSGTSSKEWENDMSRGIRGKADWKTKDGFCSLCGAWKGQFGLEPTFDLYIKHLCDIFNEVKRVLRKDGTCFVNIGDTYYGGHGQNDYVKGINADKRKFINKDKFNESKEIPHKNLCLIPFRFALEMQNRGWICRNTIIWYKRNVMPCSVKDRFTVDFEYIFFFVKSKKYFFERQYEEIVDTSKKDKRKDKGLVKHQKGKTKYESVEQEKSARSGFFKGKKPYVPYSINGTCINSCGRNKRAVWDITTKPFKGSHFAVFPEDLVKTPILSGCPEFVCKKCGKIREKILEIEQEINEWNEDYFYKLLLGNSHTNRYYKTAIGIMKKWMIENNCYNYEKFYNWYLTQKSGKWESGNFELGQAKKLNGMLPFPKPDKRLKTKIKGYSSCSCNAGFSSGIVLDPFAGSGTTLKVARDLGRDSIGIEIKKEYCDIIKNRLFNGNEPLDKNEFEIII